MDRSHIEKFNRRVRSAKWADRCLRHATEEGSMHRARRASYLMQALSVWLDKNAPLIIEAYYEGGELR
jgi:hypothetical protein